MITDQELKELGFKESVDEFSGKQILSLDGKVVYNLDKQTCNIVLGEYCIISRECKTNMEIIHFIYCIDFLFNLSIGQSKSYNPNQNNK